MAVKHTGKYDLDVYISALEAEIIQLKNLAADLMDLVLEMPVKHPQQDTRRKVLKAQSDQLGIYD